MTMIKTREPAELDKSGESAVEGEIREFVRRDVANLRRQPESDSEMVASNIGAMLHEEGARVQREIVEYATLSQAAMQSTKISSESLTHWKKVPDAPSIRE